MCRHASPRFALIGLTALFLLSVAGPPAARAEETRERALPASLKGVVIRDGFTPARGYPEVGTIHALAGRVVVVHQDTQEGFYGREGDAVFENDALTTLSDSRCRIRFRNEDVVTLASDTSFAVERYQDRPARGRKASFFSMVKGKAMFYAMRLFKYRSVRFRLRTPTTVAAVRGTKFGAAVTWVQGEPTAGLGVRVADRTNAIGPFLSDAESTPGGTSYTDLFSEDGVVEVNGATVGPGQMYRGRTGAVVPTPPGFIRAFEAETRVSGGGSQGGDTGESTDSGGGATNGTGLLASAAPVETVLDTTLQQVGEQSAGQEESLDDLLGPGKTLGKVSRTAALIVGAPPVASAFGVAHYQWPGPPVKTPVYTHDETTTGPGGHIVHTLYEALHPGESHYLMTIEEEPGTGDMKVTAFDWDAGAGPLGSPHSFEWNKGGGFTDRQGQEYLTWGWWEDTSGMSFGQVGTGGGSKYFAADGNVWKVEGLQTHPEILDILHRQDASYAYSGEVKGVFGDSAAQDVRILSGPFSCTVDFGSRQVSDFTIDAKDGGAGPTLVDLAGGSGSVAGDGAFSVSGFSGTINGSPIDSSKTDAQGAVFGGKAEGVGGTWRAHGGNRYWATGEFHGER